MERKPPTWFGFTLTQKQSVSLFVFALIGVLICVFVFLMAFTSMFMSIYFYYTDPYYMMDDSYFTYLLVSQLPLLIFFFVIFVICCYSLSMCRKSAKYYNHYHNYPQTPNETQIPRTLQIKAHEVKPIYNKIVFCPNCGTKHGTTHLFCTNCGYELR